MINRLTRAAAALAVLLAVAAPGERAAAQVESTTMAIPANAVLFAPIYIAADTGIFKANQLDVKLVMVAGPGAANAVLAGSADFASIAGGSVLRTAARGQPMLAIANTIDKLLLEAIVSKASLEKHKVSAEGDFAKRVMALKGMTVAVDTVNGLPHGYLRYISKKVGLDPEKDVVVTSMQPPNMLSALKSGTVDAFIFTDPFTTMAVKDGGIVLIRNPELDAPELNPFAFNLIITRQTFCTEKRSICQKIVASLKTAVEKMQKEPDAMLAVIKPRFAQVPPDMLAASFKLIAASSNPSLTVSEQAMRNTQEYSIGAGLMTPAERIEPLSKIYTNDFTK
ncbi:ABC transporter substrate-binding protein [Vineibacter terrae]|uniref:ABC transporter substrate-binding protein n=1 Tax=Vineibacter terrae TaxID=2586908 RepID=A0A5C8PTZ4_9HYPH|nr:ABC transporter substrate-binding protein [Vineibacter terrae]TXL81554.1 ABC transporter substrate-binding protein [Vineibacter terrae]